MLPKFTLSAWIILAPLTLSSCGERAVTPDNRQDEKHTPDDSQHSSKEVPEVTDYTFTDGVLTLGDGVTHIKKGSFRSLSGITKVVGPGVTEVADSAFFWFTSLREIDFPLLKTVAPNAFRHCTELISTSLPEVETIGDYAFGECHKIEKISLPKVKSIGTKSFYDCPEIQTVTLPETAPKLGIGTFSFTNNLKKLIVPKGNESNYTAWDQNGFISVNDRPIGQKAPSLSDLPKGVVVKDGILERWHHELIRPGYEIFLPE